MVEEVISLANIKKYTIQELEEYSQCPLKHLYEYKLKRKKKALNAEHARIRIVKDIILTIASAIIDGKRLTPGTAQDDFDSRLMKWAYTNKTHPDSIAQVAAEGRLEVLAHYNRLYGMANKLLACRLPVESDIYLPSANRYTIKVTDVVDLVQFRVQGRGKILQLVHFYTDKRRRSYFEVTNGIESALKTYVFLSSYKEIIKKLGKDLSTKKSEVLFVHIPSRDCLVATPDKDTMGSIKSWLYNITKSVNEEIYYPSVSKQCIKCSFQSTCRASDAKKINMRGGGL